MFGCRNDDDDDDDLMFRGLRLGDIRIYRFCLSRPKVVSLTASTFRLRARSGDSERIVRHQAIVTIRRSKTTGYEAYGDVECGSTWPMRVGALDSSEVGALDSSGASSTTECFHPNAATGFLLQSVLRGHVDARCILDDEATFWRGRPNIENRALISTSIECKSPLMSHSLFFARPTTTKASKREEKHDEIEIENFGSLMEAFCNSFDLPTYVTSARSFR